MRLTGGCGKHIWRVWKESLVGVERLSGWYGEAVWLVWEEWSVGCGEDIWVV